MKTVSQLVPLAALAVIASASAEPSAFDRLWSLATIYQNDSNPVLEEFKLRGRYHGQYHWLDSDQGQEDSWEDRRSRLGFDAKLFEKRIEIRADFQSNDGFEDVYDRLVDAYIRWKPNANLAVTAGKLQPKIAYFEWLQSSNSQPTFERSQIFNQLGIDRATGLTIEGKTGRWSWQTGVYSNDVDREFGSFAGDYSISAGLGYDAKECFGWKRADFRIDWLHSGHDADDGVFLNYDDLVTATFWAQDDPWGLAVEVLLGSHPTADTGDAIGFFIEPTYDVVPEKLQLVARVSFAAGDGGSSLNGQRRYERNAPDLPGGRARGDRYHAIYLGAQFFIHGDKLKLMTGAEYSDLSGGPSADDYEGITCLTGIRFFF